MRWLHAIKQDKRNENQKTAPELAYNGERISLTFRRIDTYLNSTQDLIWGQGAAGKTRDDARPVVNGQTPEAVEMLQAFGNENHSSTFDWDVRYGRGFNVLHMGTPKRFCRGPNRVLNMQVDIALAELGISFANGATSLGVRFEDNDPGRAVIEDTSAILLYLDAAYGPGRRYDHILQADLAKRFDRFSQAKTLWDKWREGVKDQYPIVEPTGGPAPTGAAGIALAKDISGTLTAWKRWAKEEEEGGSGSGSLSGCREHDVSSVLPRRWRPAIHRGLCSMASATRDCAHMRHQRVGWWGWPPADLLRGLRTEECSRKGGECQSCGKPQGMNCFLLILSSFFFGLKQEKTKVCIREDFLGGEKDEAGMRKGINLETASRHRQAVMGRRCLLSERKEGMERLGLSYEIRCQIVMTGGASSFQCSRRAAKIYARLAQDFCAAVRSYVVYCGCKGDMSSSAALSRMIA